MLYLGSAIAISLGSMIYSVFLAGKEPRCLFLIGMFIAAFGAGTLVFFTLEQPLGMGNFTYLIITQPMSEALYNAFLFMTS